MHNLAFQSFSRLEKYCSSENYMGYDPYDGLNSKVFSAMPFLPHNRLTRLIWIQFIKKMPLNIRYFLKIDKESNAKGIALFISGYCQLSKIENFKKESVDKVNLLANRVIALRSEGYSGNCWGYNFDWESRAFFQKKNTPTIVATSFVANALIDAYEATKNQNYLDAAISSKNFILKDLNRTYNDNGNFAFSYSPADHTSVFNASLLGARLLSRIYYYTGEKDLIIEAKKVVAYCCNYQNPDGSWYYSSLPFHQWIDNFHTGFNLECIYEYGHYSGDESFKENFNKGLTYYLSTFFDEEGKSKYYNNKLYPIDIHAPSQLIITLAKSNLITTNRVLVDKVLKWTIDNMQASEGYFFFQKKRYYDNKIPYMRWSQAWMFYALAYYLQKINKTLDV